jgi:flagellar L-ring protein precursor FlgH
MKKILITSLLILAIGPAASGESLWNKSQSRQSLFTDSKAHEVGDILTIVISENAQAEDELASSTSKSHNLDFGVTSFLNADSKLFGTDDSGNVQYPRATLDAKNNFKASGDRSRKSTIAAQIAATVRAVQRNGNLVIEGRRCIVLDGETKNIIMTGVVRPDDVSADNTIASNAIADAQITYDGFGAITDAAKPGFLTKILGAIPIF